MTPPRSKTPVLPLPASGLSVEGIDLSGGLEGRPDLYCIAIVEHGEVKPLALPIYPVGWGGHFALGSPDGEVLYPGARIEIELAGKRLAGTIQSCEQGDYFVAHDGSLCGLCAGMRVVVPHLAREEGEAMP